MRDSGCGDAQVDGWAPCPALGLFTLGTEEGEREVDAFDLAAPVLFFGSPQAGHEVGFEFFEPGPSLFGLMRSTGQRMPR
ncbi:hypothetical protein [Streptomyces atratus]|uniref:hypothetical protein n=1 Tax=Streptomyces atratus TaxID=1893 RepID=UPI0033C8991D